jgi:hypothetical protein
MAHANAYSGPSVCLSKIRSSIAVSQLDWDDFQQIQLIISALVPLQPPIVAPAYPHSVSLGTAIHDLHPPSHAPQSRESQTLPITRRGTQPLQIRRRVEKRPKMLPVSLVRVSIAHGSPTTTHDFTTLMPVLPQYLVSHTRATQSPVPPALIVHPRPRTTLSYVRDHTPPTNRIIATILAYQKRRAKHYLP